LLEVIGLLELELDFSEEDVEFVDRSRLASLLSDLVQEVNGLVASVHSAEILRSGFHVAVVGYPNAGKSSLFNALLQRSRAIVSDVAGTTRDYIQETVFIEGYALHLSDTAGIRLTDDSIELQGITLTRSLIEQSDAVLVVNDASVGTDHSDSLMQDVVSNFPSLTFLIVQNKADLVIGGVEPRSASEFACSARSGDGLVPVRNALLALVQQQTSQSTDVLVNARQATLLTQVSSSLSSALDSLSSGRPSDLMAVDIRSAIRLLGDISGESWNPDVLDTVFSRFCIGK
jgi:tRNA modification GTPase